MEPENPPTRPALDLTAPRTKSEYCSACLHPFAKLDGTALQFTHDVLASGDTSCSECSAARPCTGTVVAGKAGFAFRRASRLVQDKTRHRGLEYDGPVR